MRGQQSPLCRPHPSPLPRTTWSPLGTFARGRGSLALSVRSVSSCSNRSSFGCGRRPRCVLQAGQVANLSFIHKSSQNYSDFVVSPSPRRHRYLHNCDIRFHHPSASPSQRALVSTHLLNPKDEHSFRNPVVPSWPAQIGSNSLPSAGRAQ